MLLRLSSVVFLGLFFVSNATAQTVRFDTNVGNFDMVLNPGNDPNLQVLVDNMVAYVEAERYDNTVINRAVDSNDSDPTNDFVLQMGSFLIDSIFPASTQGEFIANAIERFVDPVVVDADRDGQVDFAAAPNVRGTVTLALNANGPNSGTSSFFINLGDNSEVNSVDPDDELDRPDLDVQGFVPFAEIPDMSTIDLILQLNNVNVYSVIDTGPNANLTLSDIPLIDNGTLVYIERAFILGGAPVEAAGALSATAVVPEPPTLVLAAGALMLVSLLSRRKV